MDFLIVSKDSVNITKLNHLNKNQSTLSIKIKKNPTMTKPNKSHFRQFYYIMLDIIYIMRRF